MDDLRRFYEQIRNRVFDMNKIGNRSIVEITSQLDPNASVGFFPGRTVINYDNKTIYESSNINALKKFIREMDRHYPDKNRLKLIQTKLITETEFFLSRIKLIDSNLKLLVRHGKYILNNNNSEKATTLLNKLNIHFEKCNYLVGRNFKLLPRIFADSTVKVYIHANVED